MRERSVYNVYGDSRMLVIDSREKSQLTALVQTYAKRLNIPTNKEWIEIGDYVIGDVCFEAKSAQDFIMSIFDGRLWTQLDNMDRVYETNIVIIYGSIKDAQRISKHIKSNLTKDARNVLIHNKFLGAISKIILDTDTKPVWVPNEEQAAKIITAVAKVQPLNREIIKPRIVKRISTTDLRADVLSVIKGVSVKKADALLSDFGSIMEIGEHSAGELSCIDGIGSTIGQRIIDVLNGEEKVII